MGSGLPLEHQHHKSEIDVDYHWYSQHFSIIHVHMYLSPILKENTQFQSSSINGTVNSQQLRQCNRLKIQKSM